MKNLKELVKFRTDGNEEGINDCLNFIKNVLTIKGWKTLLLKNNENKKNNLIAVLNGELKNVKDAIVLAGHIDTVVANQGKWSFDPFTLTESNGNLFGLGVADMKVFTSTILSSLDEIKKLIQIDLLFLF
ncbi:MAG: M20/M25/M40 family metallo-hydrolase [Clostridia bacterium]|nr:M20/M25/M40 family metallo-hydrolase [Clostridia bacterium]